MHLQRTALLSVCSVHASPGQTEVMRHAIRYADAASLRDRLQEVQQQMDRIEARRSSAGPTQPVRFRLGQRVTLKDAGRRGVICGWGLLAMGACTHAVHDQALPPFTRGGHR